MVCRTGLSPCHEQSDGDQANRNRALRRAARFYDFGCCYAARTNRPRRVYTLVFPLGDANFCTNPFGERPPVRNMVRRGVPERILMQLTEHKTESVYRRYAVADERDLRVAVERLDVMASLASANLG